MRPAMFYVNSTRFIDINFVEIQGVKNNGTKWQALLSDGSIEDINDPALNDFWTRYNNFLANTVKIVF